MAGRSHNVAAQVTTLGKRFATATDELLVAYTRLEELIARKEDHVLIFDLGPADDTGVGVESLGKSFTPIERHAIVI